MQFLKTEIKVGEASAPFRCYIPDGAPKIRPAESGAASLTLATVPKTSKPKLDAKHDKPPNKMPITTCFFI